MLTARKTQEIPPRELVRTDFLASTTVLLDTGRDHIKSTSLVAIQRTVLLLFSSAWLSRHFCSSCGSRRWTRLPHLPLHPTRSHLDVHQNVGETIVYAGRSRVQMLGSIIFWRVEVESVAPSHDRGDWHTDGRGCRQPTPHEFASRTRRSRQFFGTRN